jgi:hypothetical protein
MRRCGARTRSAGVCKRRALPDQLRCHLHGSLGGRRVGTPMHENTAAALKAGRQRWLERQRQLKAQGLIEKIPGGRRRKDQPKLSSDKRVRKAQVIIEAKMAEKAALPAKPWTAMSKAEKLAATADKGLDVAKAILDAPVDLENTKLLALQQATALTVIAQQIRVEQSKLPFSGPLPPESEPLREITIVVSGNQADEYERLIEQAGK